MRRWLIIVVLGCGMPMFGQYLPLSGGTVTGPLNGRNINAVINAALTTGTHANDIGDKINQSFSTCSTSCTVYVPRGSYSQTTSINLPVLTGLGREILQFDPGAVLTYSGPDYAIKTPIMVSGQPLDLVIEGGYIRGTPSAKGGIFLNPGQHITVRNMKITGFSTGDGITDTGANGVFIQDNTIQDNLNGIQLYGTKCSTPTGPCTTTSRGIYGYASNAVTVLANLITSNSHWGILERMGAAGGVTTNLDNRYVDNDLEANGTGGPGYGALELAWSQATKIQGNYFESSPREIVLGPGANVLGIQIIDNFFTVEATTPYQIELINAVKTRIEGNTEQVASSTGKNCFVNSEAHDAVGGFYGINYLEEGIGANPGNSWCTVGVRGDADASFDYNLFEQTVDQGTGRPDLPSPNSFTASDGGVLFNRLQSEHIANNTGLQIATGPGCVITPGAPGNSCEATIPLMVSNSGIYFVVGCQVAGSNGVTQAQTVANRYSNRFVIYEAALTASGTGGGTITCLVVSN